MTSDCGTKEYCAPTCPLTTATTTTTTGPTTTTTTGPTTTVTTTTVTTTTTTTTTVEGAVFSSKLTMTVADTSWVNNSNAHDIMKESLVAAHSGITNVNQVNIISLRAVMRRLQEFLRRLAAGSIECVFEV